MRHLRSGRRFTDMSRKFKALLLALGVVAQLAVVVAIGAGPASASTGPADDRQMTTPTSWWTYSGVTATQVGNLLSANHARLTDIGVDDASIPSFTVEMVRNSGSYASGWWRYYGQTTPEVRSLLSTNNARMIGATGYITVSAIRIAQVIEP